MADRSSPATEVLGWPSQEVIAREIRRAMLDNPTDDSFNKRSEKREAIANEVAGVIMARFCAALPVQAARARGADILDAEIKRWENDKRVLYPDSEVLASLGKIRAHLTPDAAQPTIDPATVEACAKIAAGYDQPGRFKVSDTWKDELSPAAVYETAMIDASNWIAKEIRGLAIPSTEGK